MASGKVGRPGHHHAPHRKSSHADPFASGPAVNAASGSSPPEAAFLSEPEQSRHRGSHTQARRVFSPRRQTGKPERQLVALQQNTDRIQTTHIGSLPRPHDLLDIMKAKLNKQPYDETEYQAMLAKAVDRQRPQAGRVRHRHRHRRRVLQARLLHLHPGAARRLRGAAEPEADPVPAGGRGVSGILRGVFQAGDDGRHARSRSRRWSASGR